MAKTAMGKKFVDNRFAKSSDYGKVISEIESTNKCPFCKENFKYHKNPILKTEGKWFITKNSWPYENTEHHFLLIGERHKETFSELSIKDLSSVKKLIDWAIKKFKIPGGGLAIRFGDTGYTGSTVCHLHFHLIVPKKSDAPEKTVETTWFPFG